MIYVSMPQKPRELRANLLLLTLSIGIGFLASELAARAYFFGWSSIHPTVFYSIPAAIGNSTPGRRIRISRRSQSRGITHELIPNNSALFKKVPVVTNSDGMRDREYTLKKPKGTFRVAVVGDSITFPDGVSIEDAYHSLLEEELNRNSRSIRYEFLNFGVPNYGPREYLAVMEEKALRYDPDLILIGFTARNDYKVTRKTRRGYIARKGMRSVFLASLAGNIHRWVHRNTPDEITREEKLRYQWMNTLPNPHKVVPSDEDFAQYEDALSEVLGAIGSFGREHSIPIIVATLDHLPVNSKLIALLEEHEAKGDFSFFDTSQKIPKNLPAVRYAIYRGDPHPNAMVHSAFAEALYNHLVGRKLIPTD